MITQIVLKLEAPEHVHLQSHFAYGLYGALTQKLPAEYSAFLHRQGTKPVHMFLLPDTEHPNCGTFTVNLLNEEAAGAFLPALTTIQTFYLDRYGYTLRTVGISEKRISEEQMISEPLSAQECTRLFCRFITPVNFKSRGRYAEFPTARLIVNSAASRYIALQLPGYESIPEPELLPTLCSILECSLKRSGYFLKDAVIPGFTGSAVLSIDGGAEQRRRTLSWLNLLPYTGTGIKTTLGMGAIEIVPT